MSNQVWTIFRVPPVVPGCAFPQVLQIFGLPTATSVRVIQAHIGGQKLQAREVEEGRSSGSRKVGLLGGRKAVDSWSGLARSQCSFKQISVGWFQPQMNGPKNASRDGSLHKG